MSFSQAFKPKLSHWEEQRAQSLFEQKIRYSEKRSKDSNDISDDENEGVQSEDIEHKESFSSLEKYNKIQQNKEVEIEEQILEPEEIDVIEIEEVTEGEVSSDTQSEGVSSSEDTVNEEEEATVEPSPDFSSITLDSRLFKGEGWENKVKSYALHSKFISGKPLQQERDLSAHKLKIKQEDGISSITNNPKETKEEIEVGQGISSIYSHKFSVKENEPDLINIQKNYLSGKPFKPKTEDKIPEEFTKKEEQEYKPLSFTNKEKPELEIPKKQEHTTEGFSQFEINSKKREKDNDKIADVKPIIKNSEEKAKPLIFSKKDDLKDVTRGKKDVERTVFKGENKSSDDIELSNQSRSKVLDIDTKRWQPQHKDLSKRGKEAKQELEHKKDLEFNKKRINKKEGNNSSSIFKEEKSTKELSLNNVDGFSKKQENTDKKHEKPKIRFKLKKEANSNVSPTLHQFKKPIDKYQVSFPETPKQDVFYRESSVMPKIEDYRKAPKIKTGEEKVNSISQEKPKEKGIENLTDKPKSIPKGMFEMFKEMESKIQSDNK